MRLFQIPQKLSRRSPAPLTFATLSAFGAFAAFATGAGGCNSLTAPPEPVPIAVDTTTAGSASAKPAPSASAPPPHTANPAPAPPSDPNAKLVQTDLVVGKGVEAKTGDTVSVHYVGTLMNGTEFDSSRKRGTPFVFTLGKGQVIRGWDQGVAGMKVGGKRKLVIPPALAYGDHGMGSVIPPNSTLTFEVELVDIKK